ncbi:hypothetical protein F652_1441 [Enterobacteriaceae bacterium bta3-1]|nr:hypothetical protein F652_1441 [Enterobacteriaceae bacterium bta3-1]
MFAVTVAIDKILFYIAADRAEIKPFFQKSRLTAQHRCNLHPLK